MADSVNTTEIAALRNYVLTHRDEIKELSLRGAPSLRFFTPHPGVKGQEWLEWADISDIVKRWDNAFSADADTITRRPVTITSHHHKAEFTIKPRTDLATYKGYIVRTKQNPEVYTFSQWAIRKGTEKIKTQQEFDQIFTGDLNAVGTTASDMYNGLLTIIADDLAAGTPKLTPITTGALTSANIIAKIRQMADSVDEKYKTGMRLFAAPEVVRMYADAIHDGQNYHPGSNIMNNVMEMNIPGRTVTLVSCPGMTGSQRLFMTTPENLWHAYDADNDQEVWEFEKDHRNIDAWCDYWSGAGFYILDNRILKVNDQA